MRDFKTVTSGRDLGIGLDSPLRWPAVSLSVALVAACAVALLVSGGDRPGRSASLEEPSPALRPTTRFIQNLAVSDDEKTLLCRLGCARLLEWDLAQNRWRSVRSLAPATASEILTASISADGTTVAAGRLDGSLAVYRDGRMCFSATNDAPVVAVACSADGRHVAWAAGTSLTLWNTRTERSVMRRQDDTWHTRRIIFSADGLRMFVTHAHELVQVWDVSTGAVVRAFGIPHVNVVAAAPDGRCLAVADQSGRLEFWNAETGLLAAAAPQRDGQCPMLALAFSPDSHWLACGCADGRIELWDVAACAQVKASMGHAGGVCELRFADRTDRLWTAGGDGTIRVWNVETLDVVAQIDVPDSSAPPRADRARRFPP